MDSGPYPARRHTRSTIQPTGSDAGRAGLQDADPDPPSAADRADFAGDLDETALDERESVIRGVLKRAANPPDYLDAPDAERGVAAAALVVAQHPAGQPACPNYGPSELLPEFPADLRTLAVDALDHVVAELSELAELWGEAPDGPKWRQDITRLRDVLDPPLPPQEEALFDI
ncbi:DUF4259 domain-containing protein [Streptomyces sp. NPDC056437]|uniref:DUF4259 domain-containing protein n=1 Tax=Streptomyces sp. NPDC056437 TaxID=3345816 RepID=UPI0036823E09